MDIKEEKTRERILFKVPPDTKICKGHREACRMHLKSTKPGIEPVRCPCCDELVNGEKYPMNADEDTYKEFGYGVPLFFEYSKHSIYLALILLGMACVNIYFNYTDGYSNIKDSKGKVEPDIYQLYSFMSIITRTTIANIQRKEVFISGLINIGVAILLFYAWVKFSHEMKKRSVELDAEELTPPDYTILLENLPVTKGLDTDTDVYEEEFMLHAIYPQFSKEKIARTCFTYDIKRDFNDVLKFNKLKKLSTLYEKVKHFQGAEAAQKLLPKNMSYVDLISTTEEMRQMLSDETSRKLGHASLGFVTFHEVETARQALLYYNNPQNTIIHKGNKISVSKAPEAYEIIWENLSCSHIERYSRIFMTCIICLLIILLTCIFNFYLGMLIKGHIKGHTGEYVGRILVALVIANVNAFLSRIMGNLTKMEKQRTITDMQISVGVKISIMLVLNCVIVPLSINVILGHEKFFNQDGYMLSLFFVWVIVGFVNPLYDYPLIYFDMLLSWLHVREQIVLKTLTQGDANVIYEPTPFKISREYAIAVFFIFLSAFCFPVFPIGSVLTTAALIYKYWVNKHLALRICKRPPKLSHLISLFFSKYSGFAIVIILFSNALFTIIYGEEHYYSYIPAGISIFLLLIIIPVNNMIEKKDELLEAKFHHIIEEVKYDLLQYGKKDYYFYNPVTTKEALIEFLRMEMKLAVDIHERLFLKSGISAVKKMERFSGIQMYTLRKVNAILRDLQEHPIPLNCKALKKYFTDMLHGEYKSPQILAKAALSAGMLEFAEQIAIKFWKKYKEDGYVIKEKQE